MKSGIFSLSRLFRRDAGGGERPQGGARGSGTRCRWTARPAREIVGRAQRPLISAKWKVLSGLLWCCCAAQTALSAPSPETGDGANALILTETESYSLEDEFHKFLASRGARVLQSYPPRAFIGYVPGSLDAELSGKFGGVVYRDRVRDLQAVSGYGESAGYAVSAWNGRFDGTDTGVLPGGAPKQERKGETLLLSWDEQMKADGYLLRVSPDKDFGSAALETYVDRASYELCPAFFPGGTYYWRVTALFTLNSGGRLERPLAETGSFTVPKPQKAPAAAPRPAPALPRGIRLRRGPLVWPAAPGFTRYRLQISRSADLSAPVLDVFTAGESFKLFSLPLERETTYYMRVMGADGAGAGAWSGVSELVLERPAPIPNDARRPVRKNR